MTALTVEMVRVLFSVGYHLAERVGWVPGGVLVVATFAAPILGAMVSSAFGSRTVFVTVAALVVSRIAMQLVRPAPYWMAAVGTAIGLIAITEMLTFAGRLEFGLGVVGGLGLDMVVRLQGRTWDTPWRGDFAAWLFTGSLCAAVVIALILRKRSGQCVRTSGSPLAGFLLGPFLYLACFYTMSPAFVASSGHLSLPTAALIAIGDALVATLALSVGVGALATPWWSQLGYRGRPAILAAGSALTVGGALLATTTGSAAIALVVSVHVLAAVCFGIALRAVGQPRRWTADHVSFTGGALVFAILTLGYQISFLVPLPVPARFMPALAGAFFLLTGTAHVPFPAVTGKPRRLPGLACMTGCLAALMVIVPVGLGATAATATPIPLPVRTMKVMTFNINQAVREGYLDLHEISSQVKAEDPDVVVMEEVGRGMAVSGMTEQAAWLSQSLAMRFVWAPAGDNQLGNLVLSKMPVLSNQVLNLGRGAGTEDRSAIFVRVDLGDGLDLTVIGAHLQNGSGTDLHATRLAEYRTILEHWAGRPRTILLGDLNTYPGWPELEAVTSAGFHTTQDLQRCSMPTSNSNCPDWIFASSDLSLSDVHVTADRPDHRPVLGTVVVRSSR
jgi:endonuclease/exonuclease/phosphatase family metal-dependent hydrolase